MLHARRSIGALTGALLLVGPLCAQNDRGPASGQAPGQMPNFTGTVASLDAADVRAVRFRYEAGARSHWHTHDGSLVLVIEQGKGRIQIKGQPIGDFGPGEPILLPAKVPHWHGAAPNEGLTWLAMAVGRNVTWMEPVSQDEYLGKAPK